MRSHNGRWSPSRSWRQVRTACSFLLLGVASLLLSLVVLPLLGCYPGSRERRERRAQRAIHWSARAYLRALRMLRILRIDCVGAERLREPGTLVVANHPTYLDVLVLMSVMPQADCVVKEQYYENPLFGGAARAAGYIPSGDGPRVVDACVERLIGGRSVIMFPEGTRSPANGLGPFQRGAAHMALRTGRNPVPVVVGCTPPTLYRGQPWWEVPERRFDLTLSVGEPLRVKDAIGEQSSFGHAARALTASMREYFEKRVVRVEA